MLEAAAKERQRQHMNMAPGRKATLPEKLPEVKGEATEQVAKLFRVSPRHVKTAKALKRKHPKKFNAVKAGKKTLSRAKTATASWIWQQPTPTPTTSQSCWATALSSPQ